MFPSASPVRSRGMRNARATSPAAAPTSRTPMTRMMTIASSSDSNVDDLADDERSCDDHHARDDDEDPSRRLVPEGIEIRRVEDHDRSDDGERQEGDDPPRHATLGGERPNCPLELEALTDRCGHSVEDLGGVPAGLALERRHERDVLELTALPPPADLTHRVPGGNAELLVGDHAPELAASRLPRVVDHDRERAGEAVPGAQSGGG